MKTEAGRSVSVAAVMIPVLFAGFGAAAHHGWGGYDAGTTLDLAGVIDAANYENPHGELQLRTDAKVWRVILAPPSRMQNRGLTADMLKPGRSVTVQGYPHKSDPVEMRAERIIVDGKTTELR